MKEAIIEDEELGRLVVRVNLRAKSLVFRTKSDAIYVSVPSGTTMKEVKRAIENLRDKLLVARQRLKRPLIDLDYKIDTEHFKLSLAAGEKDQFLANSQLGVMQIICPPAADFADENLQNWLHKVHSSTSFGPFVKAIWIILCQCENKLQSGTMGELFGEKEYKLIFLPHLASFPFD